jgi:hypothetical protein
LVNAGGGGGATCVINGVGDAEDWRVDAAEISNFVPHSSQYSEPSRLFVPQ